MSVAAVVLALKKEVSFDEVLMTIVFTPGFSPTRVCKSPVVVAFVIRVFANVFRVPAKNAWQRH